MFSDIFGLLFSTNSVLILTTLFPWILYFTARGCPWRTRIYMCMLSDSKPLFSNSVPIFCGFFVFQLDFSQLCSNISTTLFPWTLYFTAPWLVVADEAAAGGAEMHRIARFNANSASSSTVVMRIKVRRILIMIVVLVMMNVILILPLSAQVKDKGIDSTTKNLLKV